jgi:hypothetical protein
MKGKIVIADGFCENMAQLKYLGAAIMSREIQMRVLLATVQSRTFWLLLCFVEMQELRYESYSFACSFFLV